jgi:hypothetical protein
MGREMAEPGGQSDGACAQTLTALAGGGAGVDWDAVEQHLAACDSCAAGLDRFTAAIQEQFAASRSLDPFDGPRVAAGSVAHESGQGTEATSGGIVAFPRPLGTNGGRTATPHRWRRALFGLGAIAAVVVLAVGVITVLPGSSGNRSVSADRRPEFVPSLDVLPSRQSHTYYAGERIQVCLRINQPSRVHLSVLEGHATFNLYDADSDPGEHCFPEQVTAITGRATLRVEVFYGSERVAREDFILLPAGATPAP